MKKYGAEFIGTFALVFAGTGAIIINDVSGGVVTHVGVALTFGLVVLAMIYAVGDVSGAHLNPAVTLGFFAARRLRKELVLPYVVSQLLGALVASGILRGLFPQHSTLGITAPAGAAIQSLILENILTAVLMFVILNVSTGPKERGTTAGIAVGSVIALEALFAGPNLRRIDESRAFIRTRVGHATFRRSLDLFGGAHDRRFTCRDRMSMRS